MVGHFAAGTDSSPTRGGAQTKPQAIDPDKPKSCESAMLLSGGPPVPHPSFCDRQGSPQQTRDTGTILGTPNRVGDLSNPPLLWKREPVSCLPSALHSPLCLEPVLDRCHPAAFAAREGCPYVKGWTTHSDSSALRNPPNAMFPLSGPVPPSNLPSSWLVGIPSFNPLL